MIEWVHAALGAGFAQSRLSGPGALSAINPYIAHMPALCLLCVVPAPQEHLCGEQGATAKHLGY